MTGLNPSLFRRTQPLGLFRDRDSVGLIGREKYSTTYKLVFGHGHGLAFHLQEESPSIILPLGRRQHLAHVSDVRISQVLDRRLLTYTAWDDDQPQVRIAIHDAESEMEVWDVPALHPSLHGSGLVVPDYLHNGQYVLVYGHNEVRVAFSKNLVAWHPGGAALARPRRDRFDHHDLRVVGAAHIDQGLLVFYESTETKKGKTTLSIGSLLLSRTDPEVVLWRSDDPVHTEVTREKDEARAVGVIVYEHEFVFYFTSAKQKLFTAEVPNFYTSRSASKRATKLHRFPKNPVLSPSAFEWESYAVFNPAALVDNGRVHLLYRAMGPDGVSRIGYASSTDGVNFDERLPYPVYTPSHGFGEATPVRGRARVQAFSQSNPSGGGWAGVEDPRIVKIDGHAYMTFCAFDGWDFMRQAMTAISLDDLNAKNWNWRPPVLMSRPGSTQKNWIIFPEKINGKYAILHGLSPKIHVDYVDSLDDFDGSKYIDSLPPAFGGGFHDPRRKDHWDTRVRGAGAPPIKTPLGWLLLYHATDRLDPGKYKLGAMLLDLDDPTKILYRANAPVLEPEEWYENDGKPGVVYTCGAVVVGENLVVYYGGGDKHIGIARANVQQFIDGLTAGQSVPLERVAAHA
jgi:predicted GH43/DUF377 family glycosyl hydrolase